MKRKICVITGSRAEYGLLRPLLDAMKSDITIILQLIVTGMHLSHEFGFTYKEIEKDGFIIYRKIDIQLTSDGPVDIAKSMGIGLAKFAKIYKKIRPDIIIVLGDRFEILSAVIAAHLAGITIAHLYGGELTEGAIDDAFRHAITKMSHLHFTATQEYRKRIIQLGENPKRVFNVGAAGLENIEKIKLLSREKLEKELNFKLNTRNLLVTFHPVTLEYNTAGRQFNNLLNSLDKLKNTNIIFTKSNADTGGRVINEMIDKYVRRNSHKSIVFTSMGQLKYLSTMRYMDAVVGNSSSGIIEAPSLKVATVDIGDRQKGRMKAKSIIDCRPIEEDIQRALKLAFSKKFKAIIKNTKNPYYAKNTTQRIKKIIKTFLLGEKVVKKSFFNIRHSF